MKHHILIVDDSEIVRQQLRACLEQAGYQVTEGRSGEEGLVHARTTPFDLIITDVHMPGMSGLEMIAALRDKHPAYQKTPVLVLTSEASRGMAERGKAIGAMVWIVKPFSVDILLRGIARMIRGAGAPQAPRPEGT